jgi:hypothetical protein
MVLQFAAVLGSHDMAFFGTLSSIFVQVRVKQSHYRPGQALRDPEERGAQISKQSLRDGGKVIIRKHWPPLPPGYIPGTH